MNFISMKSLESFCFNALKQTGISDANAVITATALTTADAMGVFTHGSKLLAGYMRKLQGGGYRPQAEPFIERQGPAWAVVNGDSGLGQVGGVYSMNLAIEKAKQTGIAYVGLKNTGHIGAAGYFTTLATQAGLIGMVTGNDIPSVAAPGSTKAVLGSNPLAYGIPREGGQSILLDIATAAVAGGKVYSACQRGEPIPSTWLIGEDGLPTTDGSLYPDRAALAPMAGHKGYGIGLWCEILSAVIPGGKMTWEVGSWMFDSADVPSGNNASFIAIDAAAMSPPGQFASRLHRLIEELNAAPTAVGVDRVLLPGEREWNNYFRAKTQGIDLPRDVREKLSQVASDFSLSMKELEISNEI
ncbi:Ldh family oxidoreductase [Planctomicrobium sp. SH668]|uniref:Ldh family oxidoreductase n=1 Tax=Planctomicrobium sp. SH668 TaxID=3448126 RepID=UPI003F5BF995